MNKELLLKLVNHIFQPNEINRCKEIKINKRTIKVVVETKYSNLEETYTFYKDRLIEELENG